MSNTEKQLLVFKELIIVIISSQLTAGGECCIRTDELRTSLTLHSRPVTSTFGPPGSRRDLMGVEYESLSRSHFDTLLFLSRVRKSYMDCYNIQKIVTAHYFCW
ncbi:hypothetical protein CDAR_24651 [Caerostris darwini]|uniref:Secreted protein n=1 Tax=Caerostris darwini TaxID=1538125 RepID=A0AAV4Q9N9_9ARAC|nr:hypothetical protein CDAR_24651 [Caerostris darwini]